MSPSVESIAVRRPQGDAEIDAAYYIGVLAFSSDPDPVATARRDREEDERDPDYEQKFRRAAVRDGVVVGTYVMFDRWLRVGSSYLSVGCIGGVATHPDHRFQGVGTALMRDAIVEAEERQHAILLLHGIANYYHRFGYADVLDHTDQIVDRTALPTEAPAGITVRPAAVADAAALLALRERHYTSYTGCFTRTVEQQKARLARSLSNDNPPILAFDAEGNARGYLTVRRGSSLSRAGEVATDIWPAAAALLHYHSQVLTSQGDLSGEITWPVPPDSPTAYQLADNLSVRDPTFGYSPRGWSVRSQTYQHPSAGWLSRIVSVRRILESLRPVFSSRLARASLTWAGAFVLTVGEESVAVEVGDGGAQLHDAAPAGAPEVTLALDRFTQLAWGYRPVDYVASQPGSVLPRELVQVFEVLFPTGHAWILGSDGF